MLRADCTYARRRFPPRAESPSPSKVRPDSGIDKTTAIVVASTCEDESVGSALGGITNHDEALKKLEGMLHGTDKPSTNDENATTSGASSSSSSTLCSNKRPTQPCHRRSRSYFCGPTAPLSVMQG